jgi:hypothetical protein
VGIREKHAGYAVLGFIAFAFNAEFGQYCMVCPSWAGDGDFACKTGCDYRLIKNVGETATD